MFRIAVLNTDLSDVSSSLTNKILFKYGTSQGISSYNSPIRISYSSAVVASSNQANVTWSSPFSMIFTVIPVCAQGGFDAPSTFSVKSFDIYGTVLAQCNSANATMTVGCLGIGI